MRLPAVTINGIDDHHMMPAIENGPHSAFLRLPDDQIRLAARLSKSTPACLSQEADKRQSMGQLLSEWFPASSDMRMIYVIVQRREPDGL